MTQQINISDNLMEMVRREAELNGWSVADQITHWLKIGRAIEGSPDFHYAKVADALEAKLETTELTEMKDAVWVKCFSEKMAGGSAEEKNFWARRRRLGLGVGLDAFGNLVYADSG